jgi:membrane protease YdiL (CAAX protease family)
VIVGSFLLALSFAYLSAYLAPLFHLILPWEFPGDKSFRLQLLIVAPVLEELIFRGVAWEVLKKYRAKKILCTALLILVFSVAHLESLLHVPSEYYGFLIYQSLYVVPLSLLCILSRYKNEPLATAMVIHFFFNLGFFLCGIFK